MGVSLLIFTELQPEMIRLVLFAAVFQLCHGAPQYLSHWPEVPVSPSTGTGHFVPTDEIHYGKRDVSVASNKLSKPMWIRTPMGALLEVVYKGLAKAIKNVKYEPLDTSHLYLGMI